MNKERMKLQPLSFAPYLKTVIWGGDKICRYKGIQSKLDNVGESWEISDVPGYESVVADGPYKGKTLNRLIESFPEDLLGGAVVEKYGKRFPLLVKLIDARDNLSVQVHPDDALAKKRHNCLGKTEMWYVIDTDENSRIYAGLSKEITPDEYERHVENDTFMSVLAVHDSKPGDVFFLPAGRVHAIGAGNLLAEIQETSDITYRIYDYGRRDKDGKCRELHTELAKDAIDYKVYPDYKQPRPDDSLPMSELVKCGHFTTWRVKISGDFSMQLSGKSFTIVMCLDGNVTLATEEGNVEISQGNTVLLPAAVHQVVFKSDDATLLLSRAL